MVTEIIFHSYINSSFPLAIENDILCSPGSKKNKFQFQAKLKAYWIARLQSTLAVEISLHSFTWSACLLIHKRSLATAVRFEFRLYWHLKKKVFLQHGLNPWTPKYVNHHHRIWISLSKKVSRLSQYTFSLICNSCIYEALSRLGIIWAILHIRTILSFVLMNNMDIIKTLYHLIFRRTRKNAKYFLRKSYQDVMRIKLGLLEVLSVKTNTIY